MVLRKVLWFVFLSGAMAGVCSSKSLQVLNASYNCAQANTVDNKPAAVVREVISKAAPEWPMAKTIDSSF